MNYKNASCKIPNIHRYCISGSCIQSLKRQWALNMHQLALSSHYDVTVAILLLLHRQQLGSISVLAILSTIHLFPSLIRFLRHRRNRVPSSSPWRTPAAVSCLSINKFQSLFLSRALLTAGPVVDVSAVLSGSGSGHHELLATGSVGRLLDQVRASHDLRAALPPPAVHLQMPAGRHDLHSVTFSFLFQLLSTRKQDFVPDVYCNYSIDISYGKYVAS